MKRILMVLTVALVMAAMAAFSALPALAVPPHQHFLTTPGTTTEVAGGIACGAHEPAFSNFHENVHTGQPGEAFEENPVSITPTPC